MSKTGIKSKLYANTGAAYATPTWTEVKLVGDLQVDAKWNWAAALTRETPVERGARTTLPLSITGKFRVEDTDTNYTKFDDAFHDSTTVLDIMVLNGDQATDGVTGFRADFELTNWSEDQALGNVIFKDFELKPAITANLPKRVKVTTGVAAFTDIA